MVAIDMSRLTAGVNLPAELSAQIQTDALAENPFFQLATAVSMPGPGIEFQSILTEPVADWVAETEAKPVSTGTFGSTSVKPYKVAVIVPFSDEFKRDASRLYDAFAARIPNALTRKIVETIAAASGGPGITQLGALAGLPIGGSVNDIGNNVYDQLVDVEEAVTTKSGGKGAVSGYAFNPAGRYGLLRAKDSTGRPLLVNDVASGSNVPNLLGNSTLFSRDVTGPAGTVGYAADWSKFFYGIVDGIKVSATDSASLTTADGTINLWQQNMFAVRAEMEVAFWGDLNYAVRLVAGADTTTP